MIEPPERLAERDHAIEAMLPNVPFDGWTKRALKAGLRSARMPEEEADLLFPLGTVDMIATFCDLADRRMEEAAKAIGETRLTKRVRAVIALRLAQNRPHKEAIRRALAVLALPVNSRASAAMLARTVDAILHAAGDRSADFSWYTKRAILAGVYSATILFWLRDSSEENEATLAFLDRRLAGIGRIGRLRRRVDRLAERLPALPKPRLPFANG
ncbi:MAG TPA: COQ9 family protein [Rhodopila sp.]|uniref:COQ9 family protein n=1 Tax=Rhodopila sp. TaxID=2480087 RepID=UPI002C289CA9|nr:COQ9 family protein [Rhodopila sp.]HVY17533.1 COQ9 family protein [Rhodopila sp.]